jgi:2-iminobutanoate/2-iminopropanoate deaminase
MKTLISSEATPTPVGPYSPGLSVGGWIFLSGQGGFDPETRKMIREDIAEQTAQTFRNIEVLLEAAGASLDDVVSCMVHLADLSDYAASNGDLRAAVPRHKASANHFESRPCRRHARRDHRRRSSLIE